MGRLRVCLSQNKRRRQADICRSCKDNIEEGHPVPPLPVELGCSGLVEVDHMMWPGNLFKRQAGLCSSLGT